MSDFSFQSTKFLEIHLLKGPLIIYKELIDTQEFETSMRSDFQLIGSGVQKNFFEEHGHFIHRHFLSGNESLGIELWLTLLERIKQIDPLQYNALPKGTAYFWAGIYSLKAKRFDDAIQWLEYAFEADRQADLPANWLLTFEVNHQNDFGYTKDVLLPKIKELLGQIQTHDQHFGLDADSLRTCIKAKIVNGNASRPLRAAWAALLVSILEYDEIKRLLSVSPQNNEAQFKVNNFFVRLTLILETFIAKSERAKPYFLFNWEDIRGTADSILTEYIIRTSGIGWVKTEQIIKSPDGMTITYSKNNEPYNLSLTLKEKKAVLNHGNKKLDTFIVKDENGKSIWVQSKDCPLGELYGKVISKEYGFCGKRPNAYKHPDFTGIAISKDYSRMSDEIKTAEQNAANDKRVVSFVVAQRVRNASHHLFNEVRITDEVFEELSLRIYYAIFSVIEKLYGQGATP